MVGALNDDERGEKMDERPMMKREMDENEENEENEEEGEYRK